MNVLLFAIVVVLWSFGWIAMRLQIDLGPAGPAVVWRLILAAGALQLWLRATGRHPGFAWRDVAFVAIQGLGMFAINNFIFYESLRFIASGLVAVVMAIVIPLNAFGLRLVFGTPVSPRVIAGAVVAALGLALVFTPEWATLWQDGAWKGLALGVAGSLVVACANMAAVRNARERLATLAVIADGLLMAGVFSAVVSLLRGHGLAPILDPVWLGALAFQAFAVSILSFFCYFTLQARIGADRAAYTLVVVPVLTLGLSSLFENYQWSVIAAIGAVLVASGNAIALMPRRRNSGGVASGGVDSSSRRASD